MPFSVVRIPSTARGAIGVVLTVDGVLVSDWSITALIVGLFSAWDLWGITHTQTEEKVGEASDTTIKWWMHIKPEYCEVCGRLATHVFESDRRHFVCQFHNPITTTIPEVT